ncbi:MAG: isoprenylcysteine carboxylmethyltransferase family protein [Chloroflexi bacterium]|nr:MAG: isoprenylcysteine carboxylmethyltransferase family protein [Chloroflexota bacterium]
MALFPKLELGLTNGWLLLALFYLAFAATVFTLPRPVIKRLFDRSGWSRRQRIGLFVGKLFALANLFLIIMTPLKVGQFVFWLGTAVITIGLVLFVKSLIDYRNAQPGKPAMNGLYAFSRNPQIVALFFIIVGCDLAIGSWTALGLVLVAHIFNYFFMIRPEETACLNLYGNHYRDYMARVPRYFLRF